MNIHKDEFVTTWNQIPPEIWLHIFQYLPYTDILYNLPNTCKLFRQLQFDGALWKKIDLGEWRNKEIELLYLILKTVNPKIVRKVVIVDYFIEFGLFELLLQCENLTSLEAGYCSLMDNSKLLSLTQNCQNLCTLSVKNCGAINDVGLSYIAENLSNLKALDISHCNAITDVGFRTLSSMKSKLLHFLSDGCLHVTDLGVFLLVGGQNQLETLVLDGENLTDMSVETSISLLPDLKKICFSFCEKLTELSLHKLKTNLNIQHLELKSLKNDEAPITSSSLTQFFDQSFVHLRVLCITTSSAVTNEVLFSIAKTCKKLNHIKLDWCWLVDDFGIKELIQNCKNIKFMSLIGLNNLRGPWISDIEIKLPNLNYLDCTMCDFIEDDVMYLLVHRKPDLIGFGYYGQKITFNTNKYSLMLEKRKINSL